jgi:hypothetical protein
VGRRFSVVFGVVLLSVAFAHSAYAATYYVSPTGDDARVGTSPATAWRSLTKVNNTKLKPGDSVLLQAGQTFEGPLVPWGSGGPSAPVTFSSYGTGRATVSSSTNNVVFFQNVNYVTVQNLRLTANGANMHVVVSNPSSSSGFVTIRNNLITDTAAFGINDPSLADHDWTIQGNTITDTGQTGITFRGPRFKVIGNVIQNTGSGPSEAAHGVYAKGPTAQVIGNVIDGFDSSGVSIRYQNSVVQANTIEGGLIGVTYFQQPDAAAGTSTIAYNRISDVSLAGIYLDGSTVESFLIANNTIRVTGGNGIDIHKVQRLTFANNVVTGKFADYAAIIFKPASLYVENHNLWFPATGQAFDWAGAGMTFDQYRAAARQGAGDLAVDPRLDASLAPLAGSPVIDAGALVTGLRFSNGCNGTPFSYCNRTPDIGAVERKARKRRLHVRRRRSAPTRA